MDQLELRGPAVDFLATNNATAPIGPDKGQLSDARLAREDATSATDYLGAMWRQDSFINGLVATTVGSQMEVDPNYSAFDDKEWKDLTAGINPEYQHHLSKAHSAAHARYIKDLILQKQDDLLKLGDMGVVGNVARFAVGALSPENLATGMAGGLVARGVRAAKVAQAAKQVASPVAGAAARAGVLAEEAVAASKAGAVGAGVISGGMGNAVFESLRQSVNFESDDTAVLEAALIGAAFTAPFAFAGARQAARVADAASAEHGLLKALDKVDRGETLSAAEARLVDRTIKAHEVAAKVESGEMSMMDAWKAREGVYGPDLPDSAWLDRYGAELSDRAGPILDSMFPERIARRTADQLGVTNQPLALGYEPTAGRSVGAPIQVTPDGKAVPGVVTKADLEARIKAEASRLFPKDAEKADRWAMEQRAASLGYKSEVATKVAEHKAAKKGARSEAPKDPAEVLLGEKPAETPQAATEAPAEVQDLTQQGQPSTTPQAAPVAPRFVPDKVVDFTHPKTGAEHTGVIESIREDGWLKVVDEDGKTHMVHPSRVMGGEPAPGFLKGTVGAAQAAEIKDVAQNLSRLSKGRLDIFATLNRSESENVRSLTFMLVKDPLQVDSKRAQGMTASEWKSHYKRTIGGIFHVEARAAAREAAQAMGMKPWQVPSFYHEFHSLVTRLTRGDLSVKQVNPKIAPMLERAASAQREVYKRMLEEAKKVGVKGAENIEANDFYVNRVWNHKGIREAELKHGHEAVNKLLATAINVPGFIGDTAKAARFLSAVKQLEFSKVMQNVHLYAEDMGTLRGLLAQEKLDPESIDLVVDAMFTAVEKEGSDKGRTANLKYRFDLNETLSVNTPAGVLRVSDLLENDARVLVDTYLSTMGGHAAMAKHGILSEADFQAKLKEVQDEAIEKGLNVSKDLQLLQDIYSNVVGRPMSTADFSTTARTAAALRGLTRSMSLGQLGLTAAFEMKQAIGLMGFRTFMQQLPSFRGYIQAVRNGYFPEVQLARDLEHVVAFGTEMSSSYSRAHEIDDGFLGQTLSRLEQVSNQASHAVDILSGNASFTSLTRQLSSMMATQRLADFASGRAELTPALRERLVGWGIDDDSIEVLMSSFKDHAKLADNGKVESIDWEKWSREAPGTYEKFQTVVSRMVRDAIQDQDLGETMPFMHSTLGKVFGELKTFFLVAHAKNMLKNLSYMDATAFQVWGISFVGEMLAYSSQVSLNYAHDPDKRDELLTPEAIATAAFMRSPVSGMVPFFVEQGYQFGTGGQSLLGQDSTANTGNRTFVPASLITLQRMSAAPSTAMGLLLDNGQVTQAEGMNLWKTLPLNNMLGLRNLGNYLTTTLPKRELQGD